LKYCKDDFFKLYVKIILVKNYFIFMKALDLYRKLDSDFELEKCRDDWANIDFNQEFVTENFRKRYMGILADNTEKIEKVYTAVFPSDKVMEEILGKQEKNVLLFTHHPIDWKLEPGKFPFVNLNDNLLEKFRENKISIYTLHTPLDRNGEYSTSFNFAKNLNIKQTGEFAEYFGFNCGIIGKTKFNKISKLAEKFEKAVGHRVKIWNYGTEEIKNNQVAVVAGGGNDPEIISEIAKLGINNFLTGITLPNKDHQPSLEAHRIARENKINLIGGTHHSTEKFACIKMLEYFEKIGLPAEFIEDNPDMRDLEG
jgi:putative NIF3 family GTP cyclohydrolase 1 type 2